MRVTETVYGVPGWGTGTLWTEEGLVLAHEFDYDLALGDAAGRGAGAVGAIDVSRKAGRAEPASRAAPAVSPGAEDAAGAARAAARAAPRAVARAAPQAAARAASHEAARAAPHEGGVSPPGVTVREHPSRVAHGFAPEARRSIRASGGDSRAPTRAEDIVARLVAFFEGEDVLSRVRVDLSWCTPFQRAALEALRGIPRGEVVSYGELAALAGWPGAQRAVGTLCARNRFALLVPCHRVVAAGGIGGYGSSGVEVKRRLLALEGVRM